MTASPYMDILAGGYATTSFKPYLRTLEDTGLLPSTARTARLDLRYGDFTLSASYGSVIDSASAYASYSFGEARVFAGADYISGTWYASYLGAEASLGRFDLALMGENTTASANPILSFSARYHLNDQFALSLALKNNGATTYTALLADYAISDALTASLSYTVDNIGGAPLLAAGFTLAPGGRGGAGGADGVIASAMNGGGPGGGLELRTAGQATIGWDQLVSLASYGYDFTLGVGYDLGTVDIEAGVAFTGAGLVSGGALVIPRAALYVSARSQYVDLHYGAIKHATDEYLPQYSLYRSPYLNVVGAVTTPPFEPYHRYLDKVSPGPNTARADLHSGGFLLSASRHEVRDLAAVYARYDFGKTKVFAGADYDTGILVQTYFGAEADFDRFAVSGMVSRTGASYFTSLQGTWRATDTLDISLVNRSGGGLSATALTVDYAMTDNVTLSAAYTNAAGTGTVSAGLTIGLK